MGDHHSCRSFQWDYCWPVTSMFRFEQWPRRKRRKRRSWSKWQRLPVWRTTFAERKIVDEVIRRSALDEHLVRRATIATAFLVAEERTNPHANSLHNSRHTTDWRHHRVLHLVRRFLDAIQSMGHHLVDPDYLQSRCGPDRSCSVVSTRSRSVRVRWSVRVRRIIQNHVDLGPRGLEERLHFLLHHLGIVEQRQQSRLSLVTVTAPLSFLLSFETSQWP